MIGIINYGLGNLFSLRSSFEAIGENVIVTGDPKEITACDRLILPGVGAFRDAANLLSKTGLDKVIKNEAASGKPILGICLGMQLLLDMSYEYGEWNGLGLIPGAIRPIKERIDEDLLIPQIGWNALKLYHDHPLFADTNEGDYVYFVHSYYADASPEHVIATTEYGAELTAAVAKDNVIGCQFHPEK
ncbi:MAG: imidazole glycerol phosphate synthase subunit HisH, partial [Lachnospiraceae bacterium]|nr:imidazole glycerol phosphate synthase subunit HisH [Lachnospiraceae bacterium]